MENDKILNKLLEEVFTKGKSIDDTEKVLNEGKMSLEEEKLYKEDLREYGQLFDKAYNYLRENYKLSHYEASLVLDGEPIKNVIK